MNLGDNLKNKGFTLIELIAMLAVIAILIGITIPNMSGIIGNQRENAYRVDATNLVERVKVKAAKDSKIKKPNFGECVIFTLDYLNDNNDEYNKGPNNGIYEKYESFVVYTKEKTSTGVSKYKYYVRLLEKVGNKYYGFNLEDADNISNKTESEITSLYNLKENDSESTAISKINTNKPSKCTSIIKYYVYRKIGSVTEQ